MQHGLHPASQRFFNQPLALQPDRAGLLMQILRGQGDPSAHLGLGAPDGARRPPYAMAGPIAVIPVRGILTSRPWCWYDETSYDAIRSGFLGALGDPECRAIVLHLDSPGGEVAGLADLADVIFAARGTKPVWAILDEAAYSAAYWLASACDRIAVPRTGGTGSIGVITMHVDISRALDAGGVTVTTIKYGARKDDLSDVKPLSSAAEARMQADIDQLGDLFTDTVARNRRLAASRVRAMEAGTFLGPAGVAAGLADEVASRDAAFLALLDQIGADTPALRR
ncbi:S49 family peptidase [Roseomonas sp. NAR14]|uniref:S49 family peptidase n=1 Tax=Roseomonas acroporae TaxID=2937791 RepID=A0A9X1Y6N6_9PROT|nr:S49 family peptidase [Roseomonas acroporae]MCK8784132.1 S49 family peptidase [Roseomonas acroporae]